MLALFRMVSDSDIDAAVAVLKRGGLVAFPTETVYGLGADASNPEAIARLYAAKGRPTAHPVIVHLADASQLGDWARDVSSDARALADAFWPGPLTIIVKRATHVHDAVTGGQDTVGLRVPAHPVAHALLERFGGGIAAPSANRFGQVSSTTAHHVRSEFGQTVDLVLDGGPSEVGIESTIVDVSGAVPVVLRPGHISPAEIGQVIDKPLGSAGQPGPRAPGTLARHYAPATPLMVIESDLLPELAASLVRQGKRVAVLARRLVKPSLPGLVWLTAPVDAAAYAHELYAKLRELDAAGCEMLLVEEPPREPAWAAIADRLARAATRVPQE
jgi:L-threonylcarbamoyladenylate synthase